MQTVLVVSSDTSLCVQSVINDDPPLKLNKRLTDLVHLFHYTANYIKPNWKSLPQAAMTTSFSQLGINRHTHNDWFLWLIAPDWTGVLEVWDDPLQKNSNHNPCWSAIKQMGETCKEPRRHSVFNLLNTHITSKVIKDCFPLCTTTSHALFLLVPALHGSIITFKRTWIFK